MQKTKIVSETGIAKNITNFNRIISVCDAQGSVFAPANNKLKMPALLTLRNNAQNAIDAASTAKSINDHAITTRSLAFKNINPTVTKAINLLSASGVPAQTIAQARTIVRKLTGQRADNSAPTVLADGTTAKRISVSQLSYDNRLENFSKFIDFLNLVPEYAPNEPSLAITGLKTLHDAAEAANITVIQTNLQFSNARILRDKFLYQDNDGLIFIAQDLKNYIKAIFGATSSEYKQVSKLKFVNRSK
jgi:hypothetical protein